MVESENKDFEKLDSFHRFLALEKVYCTTAKPRYPCEDIGPKKTKTIRNALKDTERRLGTTGPVMVLRHPMPSSKPKCPYPKTLKTEQALIWWTKSTW